MFLRHLPALALLLSGSAAGLPAAPPLPADALYVSPGADAKGADGSVEHPFASIATAVAKVKGGGTVVLRGGTYRERVLLPGGTAERPVVLRGQPGERAILSARELVTGWQPASGLVRAQVKERPTALYLNGRPLPLAREPNEGWWPVASAGPDSLADAAHLANRTPPPAGEVYVWTRNGNQFFTLPIQAAAAGNLTLNIPDATRKWLKIEAGDLYWLQNDAAYMDRPGEWATRAVDGGWEILLRPPAGSGAEALAGVEAVTASGSTLGLRNATYVQVLDLEIVGAKRDAIEAQGGGQLLFAGLVVSGAGDNGMRLRDLEDVQVERCVAVHNQNGIGVLGVRRLLLTHCEVAYNGVDGVDLTWKSSDLTLLRNYFHDNFLWGHPDNLQMYRDVRRVRVAENLFENGGQGTMMEEVEDVVFEDNTYVGSSAVTIIFGHDNCHRGIVRRNTVWGSGYACISFTGSDFQVFENVLVPGHESMAYGAKGDSPQADRNLFWHAPGVAKDRVVTSAQAPFKDFASYQRLTGQEAHSLYAAPRFRQAPARLDVVDARRVPEGSRNRLPLRYQGAGFAVGDNLEIGFDRVRRVVTALAAPFVTFDPPLPELPLKDALVVNWKEQKEFQLDLRLLPDSPGATLSAAGKPVGSNLDIGAYRRGDFDGDGQRDLPNLPEYR